jgi:hypothetical protein
MRHISELLASPINSSDCRQICYTVKWFLKSGATEDKKIVSRDGWLRFCNTVKNTVSGKGTKKPDEAIDIFTGV